jgi:hypothetical protein
MLPNTALPAPRIVEHEGFQVVRDDLLPGGTKRRAMHVFFENDHDEYVYASPVQGYAQVALAYAARDFGKQAVVFCAKRNSYAPLTVEAINAGAVVHEVPMGFLSVVQARTREYCATRPYARLLPFGLDDAHFILALAEVARALPVTPTEVWSITSSGVLTRSLQLAWPKALFYGVRVGAEPDAGSAIVLNAPEDFAKPAKIKPPYPSCINYDAKLWRFVKQYASPGALIWNVA